MRNAARPRPRQRPRPSVSSAPSTRGGQCVAPHVIGSTNSNSASNLDHLVSKEDSNCSALQLLRRASLKSACALSRIADIEVREPTRFLDIDFRWTGSPESVSSQRFWLARSRSVTYRGLRPRPPWNCAAPVRPHLFPLPCVRPARQNDHALPGLPPWQGRRSHPLPAIG